MTDYPALPTTAPTGLPDVCLALTVHREGSRAWSFSPSLGVAAPFEMLSCAHDIESTADLRQMRAQLNGVIAGRTAWYEWSCGEASIESTVMGSVIEDHQPVMDSERHPPRRVPNAFLRDVIDLLIDRRSHLANARREIERVYQAVRADPAKHRRYPNADWYCSLHPEGHIFTLVELKRSDLRLGPAQFLARIDWRAQAWLDDTAPRP